MPNNPSFPTSVFHVYITASITTFLQSPIWKHKFTLVLGSANLTRRNIGDFHLEMDVLVESVGEIRAIEDARQYIERLWNNEDERVYTASYEAYASDSFLKKSLYHIMEKTGMCSF